LPASNRATSLIGGQRGAYYVTRPSSGRVAYDVHRPAESPGGFSRNSGEAPRAYSSGGSGAPVFAPHAHSAPASPPVSSAPHVSGGGGFSGGGFHGGGSVGFSGGGGFHGGGGRR
jgi:hypothetical protein